MKPAAFGYARPADLAALFSLMETGHRPMAGGQSLGPMLNLRLAQPEAVADLRHLPALCGITLDDEKVRIGATTTHAALEDGAVPGRLGQILAATARRIAYRPVRNRGTIGGSMAHADPAADWVAVLPALAAQMVLAGPAGERRVPAEDFMLGVFETALAEDEVLVAVEIAPLPPGARWGHWKFCRKTGEFSKATACLLAVPGQSPRAVLAALEKPPLVIRDASALLADPVAEAERIVAQAEVEDPWRRAIAGTALRRAVEALA